MNAAIGHENALGNWSKALASAPYVTDSSAGDDPSAMQRLADGAASLHGLAVYVIENYPLDGPQRAELERHVGLLAAAASILYRRLGLSVNDSARRLERMSGAMMGTALHMNLDPFEVWHTVRLEAAAAETIEQAGQ